MKIAHYLFITLFFLITQNYCVSQTIEAFGDTNISIEELLAARGETNAARFYTYLDADEGLLYTNDEKIKAAYDSSGYKMGFPGAVCLVDDKYVLAISDSGVYYETKSLTRFVPHSQVKEIIFHYEEVYGFRWVRVKLVE